MVIVSLSEKRRGEMKLQASMKSTPAFPRMQDICTIVEPDMLGNYRLMCVLLHLVKMVHSLSWIQTRVRARPA